MNGFCRRYLTPLERSCLRKLFALAVSSLVGVLSAAGASAIPQVNLSIISRDECVFGDMDLIIRDLARDYSLGHFETRLLLHVRKVGSHDTVFSETLVNLQNSDRRTDLISRVFEGGLNFSLSDLSDGEYSVSVCKVASRRTTSCDAIQSKAFEEMAKDHQEDLAPSTREDRLYYFNTFTISPAGTDISPRAREQGRILNSMPLEIVNGTILLDLPKADEGKCH
jgi:hypothetical protein